MTYQFDVFGQPVSVYDEDGKGASYKYSGLENKQHNMTMSSASYGYIPGGEPVKESTFNYGGAFWTLPDYAEIQNGTVTIGEGGVCYQHLNLKKGKYKIVAYFDTMTNDTECVVKVTTEWGETFTSAPSTDLNKSSPVVLEFEAQYNGGGYTVVFECTKGVAIVNQIGGYKLPYTNKTNYISFGDFDYINAGYELVSEWMFNQAYFGANKKNLLNYTNEYSNVLEILPSCAPMATPYNRVYCSPYISGTKGEVLLLSGWAKATAINSDNCAFALKIQLNNTDGTTTTKILNFNNNITDWQFGSIAVPVEKDFSSATVTIDYSNQVNTGYFDDIQLIKDNATSYVYDDEGNVVSVKTAVSDSEYKYDGNSRLVSAVDTIGQNFKYSYDDNHNLTSAVSDAATVIRYTYNSYGQAEFTETYANTAYETPKDNGNYYIFLRGTGLYLTYDESKLVND